MEKITRWELHNTYSEPNLKVIQSRNTRNTGCVERVEKKGNQRIQTFGRKAWTDNIIWGKVQMKVWNLNVSHRKVKGYQGKGWIQLA